MALTIKLYPAVFPYAVPVCCGYPHQTSTFGWKRKNQFRSCL